MSGDDESFRDLLHFGVVRSPSAYRTIRNTDTSNSLSISDVVAAYTSEDVEKVVKPEFHT